MKKRHADSCRGGADSLASKKAINAACSTGGIVEYCAMAHARNEQKATQKRPVRVRCVSTLKSLSLTLASDVGGVLVAALILLDENMTTKRNRM